MLAQMSSRQIVSSSPYYKATDCERLGVTPDATFPLVECSACSFVYAGQPPSADFLELLYGGGTDNPEAVADGVAVFARPQRAVAQFEALSRLFRSLPECLALQATGVPTDPLRVLDIGCSYGFALLSLCRKHYPYEVVGVDMSNRARGYLRHCGVETYASLDDLPLESRFHSILMNDVVEHVSDPGALLSQARSLCEPGARAWISVPDFSIWRLEAILKQIRCGSHAIPKDMNPWEHLSYFSPQTLNDLALSSGWKRETPHRAQLPLNRVSRLKDRVIGLARVTRDYLRFQRGTYPNSFLTQGVFIAV